MVRRVLVPLRAFLAALALTAGSAAAQDVIPVPPPVLTLDQEKLFAGSREAARIGEEMEQRANELAAENRSIEANLTSEELDLTEKRKTLPPEEFRALADAFDAKVQRLRTEQDAKERDLQRMREEARQNFLSRITPVLTEIARERGALVVMDRRAVLLSADSVDITEEAIERIDATFSGQGDGAGGEATLPETDTPEPEVTIPSEPETSDTTD
ncbi:OmpH family outer membrane protein [Pseudoruegeria sp. HB172150]|uniref:OmpH family outer membrane protein n=1 Tax=Pseudoruegeria sp. HB172150 TaxID=2721164 RepID=UPI001557ABBF|nr:OmpH family outer membrane protein [Pseudoruegeria sp. HB172150]